MTLELLRVRMRTHPGIRVKGGRHTTLEDLCDVISRLRQFPCCFVCLATGWGSAQNTAEPANVSSDIKAIMDKPHYKGAIWGLRVVDLDTGQTLVDLEPHHQFFIGSVRKVFTMGELLNQIGPNHTFNTPVYRRGPINDRGVLQGDLILVASGDLTMGGRTNPDGTIAVSDFDHNEANSLGNAELTKPDPLAGYAALAHQIAASGIKEVTGDVVIDDRLFQPYFFRKEFKVRPIFVNDDVVDLIINPRDASDHALMTHRPHSAALAVDNDVIMKPAGTAINIAPAPHVHRKARLHGHAQWRSPGRLRAAINRSLSSYPYLPHHRSFELCADGSH